jgi:retron-type reverse transcriptase
VVDFDLTKFFGRVNHDRLMAAVAERVDDRRVLRLIRGFSDGRRAYRRLTRGEPRGERRKADRLLPEHKR